MIHHFPENFVFEKPEGFTDPFRYVPHASVQIAAGQVIRHIDSDPVLASWFSEGKMLGVLVCRKRDTSQGLCYIAAFSGNVNGQSHISGFVPPIYNLTAPDGYFKEREAEISNINSKISDLENSSELQFLYKELEECKAKGEIEIETFRVRMSAAKADRMRLRAEGVSPEMMQTLIRESQHEKAELKRLRSSIQKTTDLVTDQIQTKLEAIRELKTLRAKMSENLQRWIFQQYIVHNAHGESSCIMDIFSEQGILPPGGTGECAAPKLLEYAYRNDLTPIAMGEFWYGKPSETAVRVQGHFYPSCTSKCGPLLGYMLKGLQMLPVQTREKEPKIIYEDKSIIVSEKPSGMPSVPGLDGKQSLQEYIGNVYSVHRLDMDTSGVMIFAKTTDAEINLKRQFEEHLVRKTYMARLVLSGRTIDRNGDIRIPLSADYDERPRQKADFIQGKEAFTEYEVISINQNGTADVIFHPITGRTHQLRVHSAHHSGLGCPIVGDMLYGGWTAEGSRPHKRLHLHALSITFKHPDTGKAVTFESKELCY